MHFQDPLGRRRVVVTGMGVVMPHGTGLDVAWPRLCAGESGIGAITRFDTRDYKTKIAGEARDFVPEHFFDLKEIRRNDRCLLFGMAAAELAVQQAGFRVATAEAERVGVIVGSGLGGLETLEHNRTLVSQRGPSRLSPFFIAAVIPNLIPGKISIRYGAKGPNWTPVSACASGAHAIGEALETIRRGTCDAVICGGAEATITPLGIGGFNAMKALSTRNDAPEKACRPWDEQRDGFVMSEGAGIVVLESLERAQRRDAPILAELVGYATTSDAHHITTPSGEGAERCMLATLRNAALHPEQVEYINAHATSTPVGDLQEAQAIKAIFTTHDVMVSATKSMHGHLLGASGAVELILTIEMLRRGVILPTINLEHPSAGCDLNVVKSCAEHPITTALSNSFGFGGTNVALAVRRW